MNEGNLIPNELRSPKEVRENGRKGGIASGKARRRKKALMQCAKRVLESDLSGSVREEVEKVTGELEDDESTVFTATVAVMANKAMKGSVAAFRELKEIVQDIESSMPVDEETQDDPLSAALEGLAHEL